MGDPTLDPLVLEGEGTVDELRLLEMLLEVEAGHPPAVLLAGCEVELVRDARLERLTKRICERTLLPDPALGCHRVEVPRELAHDCRNKFSELIGFHLCSPWLASYPRESRA